MFNLLKALTVGNSVSTGDVTLLKYKSGKLYSSDYV